jgi:D-3-phosphoglycerate dehydrogenase
MKRIVLADFHLLSVPHEINLAVWATLGAEVAEARCETAQDLVRACGAAQAIVICGHHLLLTDRVLEDLPHCALVLRVGIGYDNVDVEAATRRGVIVANCAGFCAEDVANHALAFVLACSQQIPLHQAAVREGKWWCPPLPHETERLSERTVGIIGLGQIGGALAQKVRPLVGRVLGYDPYLTDKAPAPTDVRMVALDTLLREADLVSLHIPLNAATRGLIGQRELNLMKPSAYLINTARGPIIDELALYHALTEKRLAGAALDVVEVEPPSSPLHPLFFLPNVLITGHCAAGTPAARRELWRIATNTVTQWLQGRIPETTVNPQVQPRLRQGGDGAPADLWRA